MAPGIFGGKKFSGGGPIIIPLVIKKKLIFIRRNVQFFVNNFPNFTRFSIDDKNGTIVGAAICATVG